MPETHLPVALWLKAKIEFQKEELSSTSDLMVYAARFQKEVILQIRKLLPQNAEISIAYHGDPRLGCFGDVAYIFLSGFAGTATLVDALSGGALRDAAATAAHRISPGNIRRLEISASEPFPAQDAPRDNSPPPPTVPVITYTEDNPPKREEKRSVTKSGNSPPHPWLWWTLLFLLLFAGYVRHELIAAKEMRLVRQSLARIESALSRQETATVVECPTPPDVYLSCPASRPEPAERRTRLYRSNPDNSN